MTADGGNNLLRGNRHTWLWAVLCTVGMNVALFAGMPFLMDPTSGRIEVDELIPQIQLIRIKRTETPPRKRIEPPTPRSRQKAPPKVDIQQPVNRLIALPFEVNTRLPGGANTVALPPVDPSALDQLDLGNLFQVGDLDRPLTVLSRIPPSYPLQAKHRGIEGWVTVTFVVSEQGRVEDVAIIAADPPETFNASVVACVSAWRFHPGTVEGTPVRTKVETTIRFELD